MKFKVNDKVRLSKIGLNLYGISKEQGNNGLGSIFFAGERETPPGTESRPYRVKWNNGMTNSYREIDLEYSIERTSNIIAVDWGKK